MCAAVRLDKANQHVLEKPHFCGLSAYSNSSLQAPYTSVSSTCGYSPPICSLCETVRISPRTVAADFVKAMRFRMSNDGSHSYAGGDIQRIEFQQELLMALASQMCIRDSNTPGRELLRRRRH